MGLDVRSILALALPPPHIIALLTREHDGRGMRRRPGVRRMRVAF